MFKDFFSFLALTVFCEVEQTICAIFMMYMVRLGDIYVLLDLILYIPVNNW